MTDSLVQIGKVVSINAARRLLRVKPDPRHARMFAALDWLYVARTSGKPLRCKVESSRMAGDVAHVTLVPGVTRDTVTQMEGASVSVDATQQRRRKSKADFHISEVAGFAAVNSRGESLGTVIETYSAPANDVVEIETTKGEKVMVPAVPEVILEIDFDRRTVVIEDLTPYVITDED